MRSKQSVVLAGIAQAVMAPAFAAGEAEESRRESEVTEVMQVTAGRIAEPWLSVPQPMTVLTKDEIDRQSPQVMTDLLRGQSGVFTQSSGPGQGIAIIRGLKGSEVLHLVDGMRLNMTFFRNSPSQYIALVDPYNITQIETMRGPAGTLYGSDAMGGVLQVLTPEQRFTGADWQQAVHLRTQLGSADLSKIGRVSGAVGHDGFSIGGGFTYMDFGERDLGDGGREPWTEYTARGGDAKMLWSPAADHELMLSAQFFETPKVPRYHEIVGGPGGPSTNDGFPVFFEPNDRLFLHARYRWASPFAFAENLELHLGQQVINDDRNRGVDEVTNEEEHNRSDLRGFTVKLDSRPGPRTLLVYGIDLYRDEVDSDKSRTDIPTGEISVRDPTFPDGATEDSFGAYANVEWQVTGPWLLETGLRYSRVQTDLPATAASAATDVDNDEVTGHVGSALRVAPNVLWTMNLARGFRAPNIFDLGTLGRRPNTSPQQINVPNPNLDPETIDSIDTGLKWQAGDFVAEASVFYARYHDRIEPREPTGNTVPDGQFGCSEPAGCVEVRSENITAARYTGFETGARWLGFEHMEIYGALNYTRGEEEEGDETRPANRVPPLNGQLGALWRVRENVLVEPYALFAGEQDRLDDDDLTDVRIDPDGTPGWGTANLRLAWRLERHWNLQLDLKNIFDKGYREHGSGVDAPGFGATFMAEALF